MDRRAGGKGKKTEKAGGEKAAKNIGIMPQKRKGGRLNGQAIKPGHFFWKGSKKLGAFFQMGPLGNFRGFGRREKNSIGWIARFTREFS